MRPFNTAIGRNDMTLRMLKRLPINHSENRIHPTPIPYYPTPPPPSQNLASMNSALSAKLAVKHDIFAHWSEPQLDHKVSVMYTPTINDEKRDYTEYTSTGFMGHQHTMVTYTRASDSVLCVPLMIDAAVWCDFFKRKDWDFDRTSKALAYLFKVPSVTCDPGFFHQMRTLKEEAYNAAGIPLPNNMGGVAIAGSLSAGSSVGSGGSMRTRGAER